VHKEETVSRNTKTRNLHGSEYREKLCILIYTAVFRYLLQGKEEERMAKNKNACVKQCASQKQDKLFDAPYHIQGT
jgi:hypothetical protein